MSLENWDSESNTAVVIKYFKYLSSLHADCLSHLMVLTYRNAY